MVWLVARAADAYFYCIKTTALHFRWQCVGADLPRKSWITKFDRNLALHIHQKLTHFGMLSSLLGDFMVWLVARAADTYFHYIKTTVLHFRWHIRSKIGQIWLHQISPKFVFEIFSGILLQTEKNLALQYLLFEVKKWMKQRNGHFTHSMPPRLAPKANRCQKRKRSRLGYRSVSCNPSYWEAGLLGCLEDNEPWGGRFWLTQHLH